MVRKFPIQAARSSTAVDALVRAAAALILSKGRQHETERLAKSMPDSEVVQVLAKAAVSGATTTQSGWAAELAQTAVAGLVLGMGPASGGAQLFRSALVIEQEPGEAGTSVPSMLPVATGASFVTEGQPIPLRAFSTSLVTLTPGKIAAISAYTREMTLRSSFEAVLRRTMQESVGLALDAALFGTAAAGVAPAGLRNGVTATTAATGGGEAAMLKDLGAIAAAVAPVGGDSIAFVADPGTAVKLRLKAGDSFPYPVIATSALPAGTVMAVALPALAVAIDGQPNIQVADSATLHMDDEPTDIGTAPVGAETQNNVAYPTRSLFQTDAMAMRIELSVTWAKRANEATAFVTGVTW